MSELQLRPYAEWIEALRLTKSEHTSAKLARDGYHDVDDHGCIPWPDPIPFEREVSHPDGGTYGFGPCGRSLGAWLAGHPVYIHPLSAVAGAWTTHPPGVGGWRPEDRAHHLAERQAKYNIIQPGIGAMNHSGPDMRIGLDLGWPGLLAKLRRYRALNNPADASFYDGEEAVVEGALAWIARHVTDARAMAAAQSDPAAAANLREIADMNERLCSGPPSTLREACQFLAWFQAIDRMWFCGGALSQLDELLRPYYEADLAAGRTNPEHATWCFAALFFNDTHYSQIGGPHPVDGHDVTSPVSFLLLEAAHRLRIPSNLGVRVHPGLDPALLRRSVEQNFEAGTGACYPCSDGLDAGYARNGVPMSLARMRAKVGCNWTALPGIEYCLQDICRICLVSPLLHAIEDLRDDPAPSMERLWASYDGHLAAAVETLKEGLDWHMAHHAANCPELVLNLFAHGPVERGLDMAGGGVDIYRLTTDGVGLATVADSLAAVERRVFSESRISWQELLEALDADFDGFERVHSLLRGGPRYGAGGSRADEWAARVAALFTKLVRETPTPGGYTVLPGLFSHGVVRELGRNLGATPNGRRAGGPISHSADPDPGFMAGGAAPTAKAAAVALVQPGWGNTTPLQLDVDLGTARAAGGIEAVEALIRAHNQMGGTLVNLNVLSKEQLLAAHADPSLYPDLVVRVTGYSAYFRSLSPEYRQQVVDRILAEA